MQPTSSTSQVVSPFIRFIGDSETGIVHSASGGCQVEVHQTFLDLRTAIVRGYQLCHICGGSHQ
jgi:hypothetical protein